jgi:predicted outer membrane repeat protein
VATNFSYNSSLSGGAVAVFALVIGPLLSNPG